MSTHPTGPRLWPNEARHEWRETIRLLGDIKAELRRMRDEAQTPGERMLSLARAIDAAQEATQKLQSVGPAQLKARLDDATPIHEEVR